MKSKQIGIFEAKNRLSDLVDQAERGERIYITRRGKKVALLTGVEENDEYSGKALLKALRTFRSQAKRGPEPLKDLIEEGRR
jgi:prevent-host-death family protein